MYLPRPRFRNVFLIFRSLHCVSNTPSVTTTIFLGPGIIHIYVQRPDANAWKKILFYCSKRGGERGIRWRRSVAATETRFSDSSPTDTTFGFLVCDRWRILLPTETNVCLFFLLLLLFISFLSLFLCPCSKLFINFWDIR